MSLSLDLISLILGAVLGINLLLFYERFFRPASKREQMPSQRIRQL